MGRTVRRRRRRDPHARGDGPSSPAVGARAPVIPTRVGMVRLRDQRKAASRRSPRAWGWSGADARHAPMRQDPHARGDGPPAAKQPAGQKEIPTRVGMVRGVWSEANQDPHARGDGPGWRGGRESAEIPTRVGMVRAQPRGRQCDRQVIPTRVGMDRSCGSEALARYPRAWGWTATRDGRMAPKQIPLARGAARHRGMSPVLHIGEPHAVAEPVPDRRSEKAESGRKQERRGC